MICLHMLGPSSNACEFSLNHGSGTRRRASPGDRSFGYGPYSLPPDFSKVTLLLRRSHAINHTTDNDLCVELDLR